MHTVLNVIYAMLARRYSAVYACMHKNRAAPAPRSAPASRARRGVFGTSPACTCPPSRPQQSCRGPDRSAVRLFGVVPGPVGQASHVRSNHGAQEACTSTADLTDVADGRSRAATSAGNARCADVALLLCCYRYPVQRNPICVPVLMVKDPMRSLSRPGSLRRLQRRRHRVHVQLSASGAEAVSAAWRSLRRERSDR